VDVIGSSPAGYEILREIGRGGAAVVYLAHDDKHDRLVALKVLQPNLMLTPTRFLVEIRTIAGLQHPHIIPLHDSGVWDESPYFVMPYVEGESLADRLAREGPLPLPLAVRIACEVGDALDYAHRQGIIHRDIKPANILLANDHAYVADFGIAHVIRMAASERVTAVGFAVGTPAYMSPEQAAGERELDGRSDLYSLGCVFHEMLTGSPPPRGASPPARAARISNPSVATRSLRQTAPRSVARVIEKALAPDPDKRYGSAGAFVRALEAAHHPPRTATLLSRRSRVAAAAVVLFAGGATWRLVRGSASDDMVDRSTYAVFPFRHVASASNVWLDGDGCARLLHDAMARWDGVRLVDDMRVSDVWTRKRPRTVPEVLDAARTLHAGLLAWGEVVMLGDSLEIRAVTYDVVRGPNASRQFVVRAGKDAGELEHAFTSLADSILVGGARGREGAATGTKNLVALQAFLDGREAVDHFDLDLAGKKFEEALAADESYAHAHLWLARAREWSGRDEPAMWADHAFRAVALASALPARDRMHAAALLDLAQGRMADACRRYRALIATDSLDFASWFGLGDCNARDPVVVRDARSSTGYSFRGSFHTAIAAYRRALVLVPSFHAAERGLAFSRLSRRVLIAEEGRLRPGMLVGADSQRFAAFPSFAAGTLAFAPRPFAAAILGINKPATERDAVLWSAETYRSLMADWVKAFPSSGDALESYALAQEAASSIAGTRASLLSALTTARQALAASENADWRARRSAMVVRLLLKTDSVSAARSLADSTLRASPAPAPYQAGYLAGLAMLTGHASMAATLAAHASSDSEHVPFVLANGRRPKVPVELMAAALALHAYASMGGPADSLRTSFARVTRLVDTWVPSDQRNDVRFAVLRMSLGMAYDELAPLSKTAIASGNDRVLTMRMALARHDTAAVRKASRELSQTTASLTPGNMTLDRIFHQARTLVAIGDTAEAIAQLDAALDALPRTRSILIKILPQAGAIVRAMTLRSELAWQAQDHATFERWARPAVTLWSDADVELRPPIDRLRQHLQGR